MIRPNQLLAFGLIALLATACSTTPKQEAQAPVKEDKAAATKSQAYMEGVTYLSSVGYASGGCGMVQDSNFKGTGTGPSKDWKTLVSRANSCAAEKKWSMLEQVASVLARVDMDSPWGAYFLSLSAEGVGDNHRAMWMIDLAQKKAGGRSPLFTYQKGRIFLQMKQVVSAMNEFQKAVSAEPTLVDGHLYLAEIYHRDADHAKAESHYEAALKVDAKNYRALTGQAEVKLLNGKNEDAAVLYTRASELQPNQLRPWMRLAYIYESLQKNGQLALGTYKSLKSRLDAGAIKERPDFDVNAKIKTLEQALAPRVPAQASNTDKVPDKRSTK